MTRYSLHLPDDPEEARREVSQRKLDNGVRTLWRAFFWLPGILLLGGLFDLLGIA